MLGLPHAGSGGGGAAQPRLGRWQQPGARGGRDSPGKRTGGKLKQRIQKTLSVHEPRVCRFLLPDGGSDRCCLSPALLRGRWAIRLTLAPRTCVPGNCLCGPRPEEMDWDQLDLNPRIIAAVKRAKLASVKEVLHFSGPDLQRLAGLSGPDAQHLLRTVSWHLRGGSLCTALDLQQQKGRFPEQHQRLSLGCPVLDGLLRGGLPLGGITELAGRSSVGKTQLALQLCLAVQLPRRLGGLEAGAVYVCTEDAFPDRRLQQLMAQQRRLRTDAPGHELEEMRFGDHIFIEHVADVDALLECVRRKVPLLLARGLARLVVIDSVAAPFRCEFAGPAAARRAPALQALGAALRRLSCTFRSPVLCVNQVTEAVEEQDSVPGAPGERLAPALGIAWSNQLLMRLVADRQRPEEAPGGRPCRTLRVVFAPHLPPSSCSYTVCAEGVRGTPGTQSC